MAYRKYFYPISDCCVSSDLYEKAVKIQMKYLTRTKLELLYFVENRSPPTQGLTYFKTIVYQIHEEEWIYVFINAMLENRNIQELCQALSV